MAALIRPLLAGIALAAALPAAVAGVITYVQDPPAAGACPTARCDALGYPVPRPVESQTAVAGFRSYAALQARLQDLSTLSQRIDRHAVGRTAAGRDIYAYTLSDADNVTDEGFAEGAVLYNAAIHAREWAAPEVAGGLIERFAAGENDAGLYRYLLENLQLVVIPTLNVDGALQTQRYPDQALETEFTGSGEPDVIHSDPPDWPRDGRMRRKNMRCDAPACRGGVVDETLAPSGDGLYGTDNNRNNAPYFGSGIQNSSDARSLIYRGTAAGSEAENQALYAAAALGPAPRLRLFVDLHSYSRVFFGVDTGNARHDRMAQALHQAIDGPTGRRYDYRPEPAGSGIGSTDEYFSYTYQIPSYTLEIEPQDDADYSSYGVSHTGFILPASQIARVREELGQSLTLGAYRMAGPPSVRAAQIRRRSDGQVMYAAQWQRSGNSGRALVVDGTPQPLQADTDYTLWLAFNKPMRVRNAGGAVVQYAGQNVPLAPTLGIAGVSASGAAFSHSLATTAQGWRAASGGAPSGALRYGDDAYAVDFRLPASLPLTNPKRLNLTVDAQDFSGLRLDANPTTVADYAQPPDAAAGGWLRYEDDAGRDDTDSGGSDPTLRLVDDGSAAFPAAPAPARLGSSGGGVSSLLVLCLMLLLRRLGLRRRSPALGL